MNAPVSAENVVAGLRRHPLLLVSLALTILATTLSFTALFGPIQYDESHTALAYVKASYRIAFSDYRLPNNHLLNTFFSYIIVRVFGFSIFTLRAAAFVAGVACIPLTIAVAKKYFNTRVAILSGLVLACLPVMIRYSSESRGYSLQMLIVLASLLSIKSESAQRRIWWVTNVLSALGMWCIPTHLLILPGIYLTAVWLNLQSRGESVRTLNRHLPVLVVNTIMVVGLTLLLYSPVIATYGLNMIVKKNASHVSLSEYLLWLWNFIPGELAFMLQGAHPGTAGIYFLLGGLLFISFWSRKQLGVQVWIICSVSSLVMLAILRAEIFSRNYLFMLPLILMVLASGVDSLLIQWQSFLPRKLTHILGTLALLAVLLPHSIGFLRERVVRDEMSPDMLLDALNPIVARGDYIATTGNMFGRLSFYFSIRKYGLAKVDYDWNHTIARVVDLPAPLGQAQHEPLLFTTMTPPRSPLKGATFQRLEGVRYGAWKVYKIID